MNIVIFWGRRLKSNEQSNPFRTKKFGAKGKAYIEILQKLIASGHTACVCFGLENYLGFNKFKNVLIFSENEQFNLSNEEIVFDRILDLSSDSGFPDSTATKVINTMQFKSIAADKLQTYLLLKDFSPYSELLGKQINLSRFSGDKVVVKPRRGFGGKEIVVLEKDQLQANQFEENEFLAQELVSSEYGIEGIVTGKHDLRLCIADNNVIWAHVRKPKEGAFLANMAQGGTQMEIDFEILPQNIKNFSENILTILNSTFGSFFGSIDLANTEKGPILYEINNRIGFPRESSQYLDSFVLSLCNYLTKE